MAFNFAHREIGFAPDGGYPRPRMNTFDVIIGPVSSDMSRMAGAEEGHFALGAIQPRLRFASGRVNGEKEALGVESIKKCIEKCRYRGK